jgi:hypothetical protein
MVIKTTCTTKKSVCYSFLILTVQGANKIIIIIDMHMERRIVMENGEGSSFLPQFKDALPLYSSQSVPEVQFGLLRDF